MDSCSPLDAMGTIVQAFALSCATHFLPIDNPTLCEQDNKPGLCFTVSMNRWALYAHMAKILGDRAPVAYYTGDAEDGRICPVLPYYNDYETESTDDGRTRMFITTTPDALAKIFEEGCTVRFAGRFMEKHDPTLQKKPRGQTQQPRAER